MTEKSSLDEARSAALSNPVRFEVIEHGGKKFGIRQMNNSISKLIAKHGDDTQSRLVELVIQVTHDVIPVLDQEKGVQLEEEFTEYLSEPVLDSRGVPIIEPVLDPKGRPIVLQNEKNGVRSAYMRAKMQPIMEDDGNGGKRQKTKVSMRPKYQLGAMLFDATFFDTLMNAPSDEGSFISKVANAAARVNDREDAAARAKNS